MSDPRESTPSIFRRAANAFAAIVGALLVVGFACVLGWAYHRAHHWLWDSQHVWFPVLPGIVFGYLIGLSVKLWRRPLRGILRRFAVVLAATASALVILVRLHFDGLMHAARESESECFRISRYLAEQSTRRFAVAGTMQAPHAHARDWLFWLLLLVEFAAIFFVAIRTVLRSGGNVAR